jgi:hypothetical protein
MDQEFAEIVGKGARRLFGTILKAAAITLGGMIAGGVIGGIAASAGALGGLATVGAVLGGIAVGGFVGGTAARLYVMSKAEGAIGAVSQFVDKVNKEMDAQQAPKPALTPAPAADKDFGGQFAAATAVEKPAAVEPAPVTAALPAPHKQPGQAL